MDNYTLSIFNVLTVWYKYNIYLTQYLSYFIVILCLSRCSLIYYVSMYSLYHLFWHIS